MTQYNGANLARGDELLTEAAAVLRLDLFQRVI